MEKINEIYIKCLKCGKKIYKENKHIHEIKCPKKDIIIEVYNCGICGKTMDIRFKVDHLFSHEFEKEEEKEEKKEKKEENFLDLSMKDVFDNKDENNNKVGIRYDDYFTLGGDNSLHSDEESYDSSEEEYLGNYIDDTYSNDKGLDEETIQNFPITKLKSIKNLSDNKRKCLICLENFKKGDNCIILNCNHIFHCECAKKWMKYKGYCPLCKIKIEQNNE